MARGLGKGLRSSCRPIRDRPEVGLNVLGESLAVLRLHSRKGGSETIGRGLVIAPIRTGNSDHPTVLCRPVRRVFSIAEDIQITDVVTFGKLDRGQKLDLIWCGVQLKIGR